jgi:hypothetical protein
VFRLVLLVLLVAALIPGVSFDGSPARHPTTPVIPPRPGEQEVHALAAAWPERIAEAALRDGDWMVRIEDAWFAWANGRMLPESERNEWERYAPMTFYHYPLDLSRLLQLDDAAAAELRSRVKHDQQNPPQRSEEFLGTLLHASDRKSTVARLIYMEIAGFSATVHESVKEHLLRVSAELKALRESDPEVAAFLRGVREMDGFNYRFVEGTRTRSLHSYGLAVDIIPKSYGGKHAYWQWAMSKVPDWWTIPYAQRWMPPPAFVKAFEREGFVWGGKWLFFDTMHFEYRPEILMLSADGRAPQGGSDQEGS